MITKWFKRYIICMLGGQTKLPGGLDYKNITGAVRYIPVSEYACNISSQYMTFPWGSNTQANYIDTWNNVNSANYRWLMVGADNTPGTDEDYKLVSPYAITDVNLNGTSTVSSAGDKVEIQHAIMIQNKTSDSIEIGEVGQFAAVPGSTSPKLTSTSTQISRLMIDRTVLPEKITIPAGDTGSFQYIIGVNIS